MSELDKVKRGAPRSLIYVLIPLGFAIAAIWMFASGEDTPVPQGDLVEEEAVVDQ